MTDRDAYIALNMMDGLGPVKVRALIDFLGSPQAVFEVDGARLCKVRGIGEKLCANLLAQRDEIDPSAEIERAAASGARILTPLDDEYPDSLRSIYNPPLALYIRGHLLPEDQRALGMVGSRKATHYGINVADRFAYQLAQTGFTIVSGLARGIDTAAHQGAVKAKGRTIAILGAALDQLYPPENAELADIIAAHGAVISEYPMGRPPDRQTFPYRNRIISALSMGVLVVEAGLKSGSLHTADAALEQGRSVFAVPGRIDHPSARGTHGLIKNGAKLVDNVSDILEEFELLIPTGELEKPEHPPLARLEIPLSDVEKKIVETLWPGTLDVDSLMRAVGLTSAEMSGVLLGLEMKRVINMLPGRLVELAADLRM